MSGNPVYTLEGTRARDHDLLGGQVASGREEAYGLSVPVLPNEAKKYKECRRAFQDMWIRIVEERAAEQETEAAIDAGIDLTRHTVAKVDKAVGELVRDFTSTPRTEPHAQLIADFYADQIAEMKDEAARLRRGYIGAVVNYRDRRGGGY
jgi:hypothetical protein